MYMKIHNKQTGLTNSNQSLGFKINSLNQWFIKASTIPWDAIEERYASLYMTGCKAFENGFGVSADTEERQTF